MTILKKIVTIALLAMLGLAFAELAANAQNKIIKALLLLPAVIALWLVSSNEDCDDREGSAFDWIAGRFALVYGLGAGVFLTTIGMLGFAVADGGWVSSLKYALPFGLLAILAVLFAIWRRSQ